MALPKNETKSTNRIKEKPPETSYDYVLRTKLQKPKVTDDVVSRECIKGKFDKSLSRRVTLIVAPAGYGKSTVASQLVDTFNQKNVWFSLDEESNNVRTFIMYLLSAIRHEYPEADLKTERVLRGANLPPRSEIVTLLLNDFLDLPDNFTIVLDDVHLLDEKVILSLISNLLEQASPNVHFIINSRKPLSISLTRLRAKGEIVEIGFHDLQFSEDEIREFISDSFEEPPSSKIIMNIKNMTEGWVTGLRLVKLSLEREVDDKQAWQRIIDDEYMHDYLMAEVLSVLKEKNLERLLKISILDEFNLSLCTAVLSEDSKDSTPTEKEGRMFIDDLKRLNLFIVNLDKGWFRLHHYFRDILRAKLREEYSSKDIAALGLRVSRWFEQEGNIEEAISFAHDSGDLGRVAELIERNARDVISRNDWPRLAYWLMKLPSSLVEENIVLMLAQAWIYHFQYNVGEIPGVIEKIERFSKTKKGKAQWNDLVSGEIDFFRGFFAYYACDCSNSLKYLNHAIRKIPKDYKIRRGEVLMHKSLSEHMNGQGKKTIEVLNASVQKDSGSSGIEGIYNWGSLMFIYLFDGNLFDSAISGNRTFEIARDIGMDYHLNWGRYINALCSYYSAESDCGEEIFESIVESPYSAHHAVSIDSFCILAILAEMKHCHRKVDDLLVSLRKFVKYLCDENSKQVWNAINCRIALMRGDMTLAKRYAQKLDPIKTDSHTLWWVVTPSIEICRYLLAQEDVLSWSRAVEKLKDSLTFYSSINNNLRVIQICVLLSVGFYRMHDAKSSQRHLTKALRLASKYSFARPFIEHGSLMSELLSSVPDDNSYKSFVETVIRNISEVDFKGFANLSDDLVDPLTDAEIEILTLLSQRFSYKECAKKRSVSVNTAKKQAVDIYRKLNVHNRRDAVKKAESIGLLVPPSS